MIDNLLLDNEKEVLLYFSDHRNESFTPNELSKILGKNISSVSCYCTTLRKLGEIKVVGLTSKQTRKYQHKNGPNTSIYIHEGMAEGYSPLNQFIETQSVSPSPFKRWVFNFTDLQQDDSMYCSIRGQVTLCYKTSVLLNILEVYKNGIASAKEEKSSASVLEILKYFEQNKDRSYSVSDLKSVLDLPIEIIRTDIKTLKKEQQIKLISIENSIYFYQHIKGLCNDCEIHDMRSFISIKDFISSKNESKATLKRFTSFLKSSGKIRYGINENDYRSYTAGDSESNLSKEFDEFISARKEKKEENLSWNKLLRLLKENIDVGYTIEDAAEKIKVSIGTVGDVVLDLLRKKLLKCVGIAYKNGRAHRKFQVIESPLQELQIKKGIPEGMTSVNAFIKKKGFPTGCYKNKTLNLIEKIENLPYLWATYKDIKNKYVFKVFKEKDLEGVYSDYVKFKEEKERRKELNELKKAVHSCTNSKKYKVYKIFTENPNTLFSTKDIDEILGGRTSSSTLSNLCKEGVIRVAGKERAINMYQLSNSEHKICYTSENKKLVITVLAKNKYKGLTKQEIVKQVKKSSSRTPICSAIDKLLAEHRIKIVGLRKQPKTQDLYSFEYQLSSSYSPEYDISSILPEPPKGYYTLGTYLRKLRYFSHRSSIYDWFRDQEELYGSQILCQRRRTITAYFPIEVLKIAVETWETMVTHKRLNRNGNIPVHNCEQLLEDDVDLEDEFSF